MTMWCFWFHSDSEIDINEYLQRWGLNRCMFRTLKISTFENSEATAELYAPLPIMSGPFQVLLQGLASY